MPLSLLGRSRRLPRRLETIQSCARRASREAACAPGRGLLGACSARFFRRLAAHRLPASSTCPRRRAPPVLSAAAAVAGCTQARCGRDQLSRASRFLCCSSAAARVSRKWKRGLASLRVGCVVQLTDVALRCVVRRRFAWAPARRCPRRQGHDSARIEHEWGAKSSLSTRSWCHLIRQSYTL